MLEVRFQTALRYCLNIVTKIQLISLFVWFNGWLCVDHVLFFIMIKDCNARIFPSFFILSSDNR